MTSAESEKCNQLLKACRLPYWCMFCALPTWHQQTESTGQKPDKAGPRPGQAADRSMKTRSASLSETLLADQRKNKGFKLNCRGGGFLKGWGYARSWMSSPCVTKNPMSNNKPTAWTPTSKALLSVSGGVKFISAAADKADEKQQDTGFRAPLPLSLCSSRGSTTQGHQSCLQI